MSDASAPAATPAGPAFPAWLRNLEVPEGAGRAMALSTSAGLASASALALSPAWEAVPPIALPLIPFDLRFWILVGLFPLLHGLMAYANWPTPAAALPTLALAMAVAAHWQNSAILGLLTPLEEAQPGFRVPLLRGLLTGAALLLALWAAMDRGRARAERLARQAGLPEPEVAVLRRVADAQAGRVMGFTSASFVALLLVALVGDGSFGGSQAPLPELVGAAVAVGVAVLLFPGAARRQAPAPPRLPEPVEPDDEEEVGGRTP